MLHFTIKEAAAAMNALYNGGGEGEIRRVSIDSRDIEENTLFIAIKGERFDGHDFLESALASGAVCAVSHRKEDMGKPGVMVVDDTEQALCDLAHAHRMKFDIPVAGVTGSVGKTTTKEMIACCLATKYQVKKTEGNHNNQIGMPRTLLELTDEDTAAVMEMGSQGPGEIRQLTLCAAPQVAVITKIGVSHLERFGSQENILKGKLEIAEGLPEDGTLVLNADDPFLASAVEEMCKKHHLLTYAVDDKTADIYAKEISGGAYSQSFIFCYGNIQLPVFLPVGGLHNVYNALAALSVAVALGVDLKAAVKALGKYEPSGQRQKVTPLSGRTMIEDCYNASPDSMEAALKILSRCEGAPRIAVLGDMLELGDISKEAHHQVGVQAASLQLDLVLCVGEDAKEIVSGVQEVQSRTRACHFESKDALCRALEEAAVEGCTVLFKGSRGMHMEQYLQHLEQVLH